MKQLRKFVIVFLIAILTLPLAFTESPLMTRSVMAASSGPLLLGITPSDNSTSVPASANLVLTFDESVQKGTGSAAVYLRRVVDNALVESFIVSTSNRVTISSSASNIVSIDPTQDLTANMGYYVVIDPGAFRNQAGTNYAGLASATAWNFTVSVVDNSAPTLIATANEVDSGQGISMTFNEAVYASNGTVTFRNQGDSTDVQVISVVSAQVTGSGSATVTIMPGALLRASAAYTVTVSSGAFQDASGNNYGGTSWTLNVKAPPMAIPALFPGDNLNGVALNTNLRLTFAGNIAKGAASRTITIKKISNNDTVYTVQVGSGAVAIAGPIVTITMPGQLAADTGYYVLIEAGAFVESANPGNAFQGISDATVWNFSTSPSVDTTRPTIALDAENKPKLLPQDNGTVNTLSASLEIHFSEPVYPGTGNITIRNTQNDMIFESIPVTSTKVMGGGTNMIKITPGGFFVNNSSYYVQISSLAFRDAAGNNYLGISDSDKTTWNFHVTQDSTVPTIAVLSPANGTTSVGLNDSFTVTFSEPVVLGSGNIVIRRAGTGSSESISTTAAIDSTDSKKLIITPSSSLVEAASYYMEIPAGAVKDLGGNPFGGVLNENYWAFQTVGSDTTAPVLSTAVMSGSTKIELTYNEELNSKSVPAPGNYYVTVNDALRAVTEVTVSEKKVTLTLASGVIFGQVVKLYYSQGIQSIEDLSGNKAAVISGQTITNASDTTLPTLVSGTLTGSIVTLNFNEELQTIHSNAYQQFVVYAGGSAYAAVTSSGSGSTVILTLSGSIMNSSSVYLNYTPGSYPLRDQSNNMVQSINSFYLRNTMDTTAPIIQSATATGSTVTLTYNEGMDSTSRPSTSQFSVSSGNTARNVTAVSISNATVTLTLGTSIAAGETTLVSYLGGSPSLRDLAGNAAAPFSNMSASTGSASASNLLSASSNGKEITLTFNQALNSSLIPTTGQFIVKVNGSIYTISGVAVSGSTVRLTLAQSVGAGSAVTVAYFAVTGSGLHTAAGSSIPSFPDFSAANVTGTASGGSLATGVELRTIDAVLSSGMSPGGKSARMYSFSQEKVITAFTLARANGGGIPAVIVSIPSTDAAALIAIPLSAVDTVVRQSSNAVFAVKYKDTTYELPLNALDYTQIGNLVLAGGGTGNLLIEIDMGADASTAMLRAALSSKGIQPVVDPIHYEVSVSSGTNKTEISQFKTYSNRTYNTSLDLEPSKTAVVWLDPSTGMLSYVPTQITRTNGTTTVTFKMMGNSAYAIVKGDHSFTDLPEKHWAYSDIILVANKFIAEGRTVATFDADKPITRGEFASYIARGLGLSGDKTAASKFKDVNNNTAMAAYIGAAAKAGVVAGITADTFQPNSPITREQMAAMMVRAIKTAGVDILLSQSQASYLQRFKDNGTVSSWARTDVAKAVDAGIIAGVQTNVFSPKTYATRAQAVVMIKRVLEHVNFIDSK